MNRKQLIDKLHKKESKLTENWRKVIFAVVSTLFWLGVWWLLSLQIGQSIVLPTPLAVLHRLIELVSTGAFWLTSFNSIIRVTIGLGIGLVLGAVLAYVASRAQFLNAILTPFVSTVKSTPVASVIIVVFYIVDKNYVPSIVSGLMVMPIIYMNVKKGIDESPKELLEVADVFGLSDSSRFLNITLRSIIPYLVAGIRSALGLAWKAGITAEVICRPNIAIGTFLNDAKVYLESEDLFAWTVTVIVLSMLIEKLLVYILTIITNPKTHTVSVVESTPVNTGSGSSETHGISSDALQNIALTQDIPLCSLDAPIISLKNVSKSFGSKNVLSSVDLDIHSGETIALMGTSGAGKTTLVRILLGLEQETSGVVEISDNVDISVMFPEPRLFAHLSVLDNLLVVTQYPQGSKLTKQEKMAFDKQKAERATELLSIMGLSDALDKYPAELSSGMQARVSLARSIYYIEQFKNYSNCSKDNTDDSEACVCRRSKLLILDEPLARLDGVTKARAIEGLLKIKKTVGCTILLVTHSTSEVKSLGAKVVTI